MPRPARASRRRRSSSGSSSSARSARPGSSCDSSSIPGLRPPLGAAAPAMATLAAAPLDGTARQQDNLHLVGRAERGRLRDSLGIDLPEAYRPLPSGSLLSRWSARMTDPAVWRDVAYLLLLLPLGTLWFILVLVSWSVPLALVTMPLWYRLPPEGRSPLFDFDGHPLLVVDSLSEALAGAAIGLLLGLLAATLVRSLGMAHAVVARTLLSPGPAALRARVQTLETTRARVVEAAAEERRRIERDLHDGAQQRLVALAMDLGMAMEKFASEPEAARALVEEAHQEAKRALAELRDLARGIHPAVLSDRGLDAALSALAARSPVPVEVEVVLEERLPAPVEAIAYFVAAEALVNVAKHAAASAATVTVTRNGDLAVVEVSDDGVGGADPAAGGGLAGLAGRVGGVDGRLTVASPPGGPTVVRAELPCAS